MNVNIKKALVFHKMKYEIKGHFKSHKITFPLKNPLLLTL